MKIAIIGAGAIGLLFSYYLNQKHEVTLYTRTSDQAEMIQSRGIHLIDGGLSEVGKVTAKPIELWVGAEDLTIITVKQYQLQSILPQMSEYSEGKGTLLFLQNGMGHLKLLSDLKVENIYLGSVEHGAARLNGNTVSHNGHGVTRTSVFKGNKTLLENLVRTCPEGFQLTLEPDFQEILVKKLIVNAVINPLTAAFRVENGTLIRNPFFYQIVIQLFDEVAKVLHLKDKDDHFGNVVSVCEKTSTNRSSMLKDIEAGRETEVDSILGYLLEEAQNKQMTAPLIYNYYQLIKGIEYQKEGSV
ncbi:2-dehydropantoate 2-reductase [Mesobacillus persicus]|uniref:2-dehydropantoate 2-reductase n=1 Tax=Mesobacillus persicus TaxID=930146 RepID=A0A1H8FCR9_9BACI|nr:2-dehydropantoate 2-reductase [Mesobacillus persicus]SEN29499.1 2-dehydropantoate 2-reductase [Mesobacillus persicus]